MKTIALRINEVRLNEYHIVLPHKCYATIGLFDFIDKNIKQNKIKIQELELTDEGYLCLKANNNLAAHKIADLAGNFILETILNGSTE